MPDNAPSPNTSRVPPAASATPPDREIIDHSTSILRAKLADTQSQLKTALNALAVAQKDKQEIEFN